MFISEEQVVDRSPHPEWHNAPPESDHAESLGKLAIHIDLKPPEGQQDYE